MTPVVLVVPCYNESRRFKADAFREYARDIRFLFVDDGSGDGTALLIEAAKLPNAEVLRLPKNVGKAEAIRQGMLKASGAPNCEWIGFWDADLSTPLAEVDYMLQQQRLGGGEAVLLLGSRVKRLGATIRRSLKRHFLGRCFVTVANFYLGVQVYDSQCGAKLFRPAIAERAFREPFVSRWIFDLEILLRLRADRALEIPLRQWIDEPGSKVRILRELLRVLSDLNQIKHRYRTGA